MRVAWTELASILELPNGGGAYPLRTCCPLCRSDKLYVYEDTIAGGQWHYCFGCHSKGDMIALAAAVWGMSADATLHKLTELGCPLQPDDIDYLHDPHCIQQVRGRVNALWDQASAFFPNGCSQELNRLRTRLHLQCAIPAERWRAGLNKLLGGCNRRAVDMVFRPKDFDENGRYLKNIGFFRGRDWNDVLVLPYHDMPGRICGFYLVGRRGDPADRLYRRVTVHTKVSGIREAGLAGLDAVTESRLSFGHHVFAVADPLLAARLQMRHAAGSSTLLPLVAWHDGPNLVTNHAWRALHGKRIVIWTWQLDAFSLRQAIRTDGLLAVAGPRSLSHDNVDHYLRLHSPDDLFHMLLRDAKPWRQRLRVWRRYQSDGAVEMLLRDCQHLGLDVRLIAKCLGSCHARMLLPPPVTERTAKVTRVTFVERASGWYILNKTTGQTTLYSDCIVRIDGVRPDQNKGPLYTGKIIHQGQEYRFWVPLQEMQKSSNWLYHFLAHHRRIPKLKSVYGLKLLTVALAFSGAELEQAAFDDTTSTLEPSKT